MEGAGADQPLDRLVSMGRAEAIESRGGGLMGRAGPVGALPGEEAGERSQSGEDLRAIRIADLTAIFIVGAIADVVIAVFNAPLTAGDLQQHLAVGFGVGQRFEATDPQDRFIGLLAAFQIQKVPMDPDDLGRRAEAHLFGRDGQGPELTVFHPSVALLLGACLRRVPRGKTRCRAAFGLFPEPMVDCPSN